VRLGSELEDGIDVSGSSRWVLEPYLPTSNPGGSGGMESPQNKESRSRP
jgi:hypothetical protein